MTNQVDVPDTISVARKQTITRREWFLVVGWSTVTLFLASVPFLYCLLNTPPNTHFMGAIYDTVDINSYFAKMQEGREGSWLFHLTYSPEHDAGAFIFLPYLLLGRLAGLLNLSNILVYHFARIVCGLVMLLASYHFISWFFSDKSQRLTAFLLVCFGGGVGWLLVPVIGLRSTDLSIPESLSFFSILMAPHYTLAVALLLLSVLWIAKALEETASWYNFGKAALAAFFLGWIHPFLLITIGAVSGLYLLRSCLRKRQLLLSKWVGLTTVGIVGLPGPLYTFVATNNDPVLRAWMSQNQILSPAPWFYLTGYGLLAVLASVAIWKIERAKFPKNSLEEFRQQRLRLLTSWAVVNVILLYLPVSFQGRLAEGLQIPLVCLTVYTFYEIFWPWLSQHLPQAEQKLWAKRLLFVVCSYTIVLTLIFIVDANQHENTANGTPAHPLYLYDSEIDALNWLKNNTSQDDTVITGPVNGSYVPAVAGNRVFYGHIIETINATQKLQQLTKFFDATTPQSFREQLIKNYNLHYLYYGLEEKRLLGDEPEFNPAQTNWPVVFQNQWVTIYKLN